MSQMDRSIVIVGAGLAGDRAAFALRDRGYEGAITLVGAEIQRPYDRPPLSKAVLKTPGAEDLLFFRNAEDYHAAGVELVLGRTVTAIDRERRTVRLSDREGLGYDKLVLATGSKLRTLEALPYRAPGVFYLRDMSDALALRAAFDRGGRVAVIGGGVIGLEAAATAAARGLKVTVIEAGPRLMARAAGELIGGLLTRLHRQAGVEVRCGVGLEGVASGRDGHRLTLSDGSIVDAQIVIVGVGVTAQTDLAAAAGLEVSSHGVVVDGHGRTVDPRIYAAGEGAFHFNARVRRHERQENWHHAAAHGDHVGRSLVAPDQPYAELSSYWTDQYQVSLQSTGVAVAERDVVRGQIDADHFIVFHLDQGRVVGASGLNAARELRGAKALIRGGAIVDPAKLADPAVNVSDAAQPSRPPLPAGCGSA